MHIVKQAQVISEGIGMARAQLHVIRSFEDRMGLNDDVKKMLHDAIEHLDRAADAAFDTGDTEG